ncbi:RNA polymerase subunit sigma-70 [Clostridium novyi A str. 4552]|uniref:RNA polymerase subunit sigma-70 n=1 Tax=Clostridium novyi A str. 4552 TaxID=1444289 RepID=A0A0A0IA97_CLONO|nr:sigma-70 family RNA polymerase sigma factor [Clostridium novyi]KGM97478.1 RNA polymerase subunit sigma-70 [Clostridium novyi A str. 4552]
MVIKDLIKKSKAKDEEATKILIEKYKPFILKTMQGVYIKGYDREDLIQMGYVSIIKAIEKYDLNSKTPFTSYVCNAIKNNYYYKIRGKVKENYDVSYEKSVEDGFKYTNEDSVEDEVLKNYEIKILRQALNKLSIEDKELILYCYSNGHGAMKEYSNIKGIKYGTLQKRKKSILNKIKNNMKNS